MIIFEAVRVMIMFALAFVVALLITPFVVHFLLEKYALKKKNIKDEKIAPIFHQLHKQKSETPTMGGIIIWLTVFILAFLFLLFRNLLNGFADYFNFVNRAETYLPLFALFFAALIGLFDDIFGILGKGPKGGGLTIKQKLLL